MAQFVYIDETGGSGTAAKQQPQLRLVAVIVDEEKVQQLQAALDDLAWKHLGWKPRDLEFHGQEIWSPSGYWKNKQPPQLLAAYEDAINLLAQLELRVSHATINKAELHTKYEGAADQNAYILALQFLLEKVDAADTALKVVVADETKEHQLRAVKMLADMQAWGGGEVPGKTLKRVIDSLHFVRSADSPGVQMADLVAYILQRQSRGKEAHPDVQAARDRMCAVISSRTFTWREAWPPKKS